MNRISTAVLVSLLLAAHLACSSGSSVDEVALDGQATLDVTAQPDLALAQDRVAQDDIQDRPDDLPPPQAPTFTKDMQPIFQAFCGPCHTTNGAGGTNFATHYEENLEDASLCPGKTIGPCGLELVLTGSMPMGKKCSGDPEADAGTPGCLTANAQSLFQAWLDAGMPQ